MSEAGVTPGPGGRVVSVVSVWCGAQATQPKPTAMEAATLLAPMSH